MINTTKREYNRILKRYKNEVSIFKYGTLKFLQAKIRLQKEFETSGFVGNITNSVWADKTQGLYSGYDFATGNAR